MNRIRTCLPAVALTLLSLCFETTALAQGTAQQGVATAPSGPALEGGVWEEAASRRWLAGVYAYYGARPYWNDGK